MTEGDLERLELFFGRATAAEARVYARVTIPNEWHNLRLVGVLEGPHCQFARTLPSKVAFADSGPGESLLAEAFVPDPCFWSPEVPHLYHARLELRRDGRPIATADRWLGIRPLAAAGKQLVLAGRNWVLRAAHAEKLASTGLAPWRETSTAMIVPADEGLLGEASRQGVFCVGVLSGTAASIMAWLARCGSWSAVAVLVLETNEPLPATLKQHAPNVLLAQRFPPGQPIDPAPWAQVVICQDDNLDRLAERAANFILPVMALRPGEAFREVAAARAECDRLQRDLAGQGDFCGYLV